MNGKFLLSSEPLHFARCISEVLEIYASHLLHFIAVKWSLVSLVAVVANWALKLIYCIDVASSRHPGGSITLHAIWWNKCTKWHFCSACYSHHACRAFKGQKLSERSKKTLTQSLVCTKNHEKAWNVFDGNLSHIRAPNSFSSSGKSFIYSLPLLPTVQSSSDTALVTARISRVIIPESHNLWFTE